MLTELRTFNPQLLDLAYQASEQLKGTFNQVVRGEVSFTEILPLLQSSEKMQSPDGFIRLVDGEGTPPSDIRVDLWYMPTYTLTGIMMHYVLSNELSIKKDFPWKDCFFNLLTASTGRNFKGHGIDDMIGLCQTINLFCTAGLPYFLKGFPDFCPQFTELVKTTEHNLIHLLADNRVNDCWARNLRHDYQKSLSLLHNKKTEIFVYGTLMKNRSNHCLMASADFAGQGILKDYALFELGSFPGIKPSQGDFVKGELYFVNDETLNTLNHLESEGTMYHLTPVKIQQDKYTLPDVFTYVYSGEIQPKSQIDLIHQPWGKNQDRYVWYACYGSNLLEGRFLCYLQGGTCSYNGRTYAGCTDKTLPKASKPITIPFAMYYGNRSASWNNGGVSFLDSSKIGQTLGRMYLISEEQFYEIHKQEGSGYHWYNQLIYLGRDTEFEIYTFTNKNRREKCEPTESYITVMRQGLIETYPKISKKDLKSYFSTKRI